MSKTKSMGQQPHGGDNDSTCTERDPVEVIAAEFAERLRSGERVAVEDYARRHPELAAEIRELFPTIVAMEKLNVKRQLDSGLSSVVVPKQLGDYRIVGEIARGGMGIVYEAEQVSLGRRVAVKVLPSHLLRRTKDIQRFEREALTAAKLHHSNIVPVFGVGEESGQHYIVMQLIRGVGLDEVLSEIKNVVVGLSGDETQVASTRASTAKRSAAGLLENELKLNSTIVSSNRQTVVDGTPRIQPTNKNLIPLRTKAPIGTEYVRNVARIGLQAAEALQYAHQNGTLHRDIKPGNLLLDQDGRVWIADFGLAKAVQDDDVTCSGDVVGTLAYVAPERFEGTTTKCSDIYSLGVTLHEMLTLQRAFDGSDRVAVLNQVTNESLPSPRKINSAVPRDFETIVLKAASRDPSDRYESAAQMAYDIEAFLDDRPIEARRLSYVEHVIRWSRRNRGMAGLGVIVALLLVTVFGLLAFGYRHSDGQRQKAESNLKLATDALDEIYNRFAFNPLGPPLETDDLDSNEELSSAVAPTMPISKDVAALLENLLEFYDDLSARADNSDAVAVKYIAANRRVADIHYRLGQRDDARMSYETVIERIKKLSPAFRETQSVRLELARAFNGLGRVSRRNRTSAHQAAVDVLDHPDATDLEQFELANALYLLHRAEQFRSFRRQRTDAASAKRSAQKTDATATSSNATTAASNLSRATHILKELQLRNPAQAQYDLLLARCLLANQTVSEPTSGNQLGARRDHAIGILRSLIQRFPENPEYRYELGKIYQMAWDRSGKHRSAAELAVEEARLRTGLEVTSALEIQHPNIPKYYLMKKELHQFLGVVLGKQGKMAEAETQYIEAIQMQRMLVSRTDNPRFHEPWLYMLELEYGKLLRDAGDERARELLSKVVHKLEMEVTNSTPSSVSEWTPSDAIYNMNRETLKSSYDVLAEVLHEMGDTDGADLLLRKRRVLVQ